MSFSGNVKEELVRQMPAVRHCQIAETAGIFALAGQMEGGAAGRKIHFRTENAAVARKCFTLLKKGFNIVTDIAAQQGGVKKGRVYQVTIREGGEVEKFCETLKLLPEFADESGEGRLVHPLLLQRECCKRAFVRGAFLGGGSISAPERFYHMEFVCRSPGEGDKLKEIIQSLEIDARLVTRKKNYVVYIKEGSQIVDMLGLMEAGISLMNFENVRILKEMRNNVNRKVNCEMANINKTVAASVRQIEDIRCVQDARGLESLPPDLQETARLRLEFPDITLKELGDMHNPKVGKSGVNHRLRKIGELALELKQGGV